MVKQQYFWIYLLEMSNGKYYTGYTTDLERRFQEHCNSKKGAKCTKAFKVKRIVQAWQVSNSKSEALKIEAFIKKQNRKYKEEIIVDSTKLVLDLKEQKAFSMKIKNIYHKNN